LVSDGSAVRVSNRPVDASGQRDLDPGSECTYAHHLAGFRSGDLSEPPRETARIIRFSEADFKLAFCDIKADCLNVPVVQLGPHIREKVAEQYFRRSHDKYRRSFQMHCHVAAPFSSGRG
jgi:hypothetical protein